MRLVELHPEFSCNTNPIHSGSLLRISIDCPVCGAPSRLSFNAAVNGPAVSGTFNVFGPGVFATPVDWNRVSVEPSVFFTEGQAHGRKRKCYAHFSIVEGEVQTTGRG